MNRLLVFPPQTLIRCCNLLGNDLIKYRRLNLSSGFSSVATGLAPVDRDETLHALVAAPLFVCSRSRCISSPWRCDPGTFGWRARFHTGLVTAAAACRLRAR
jgi:hypothetical protein